MRNTIFWGGLGSWNKTAEDNDGKTTRLINYEDKRHTWISEKSLHSCYGMRLKLLHFYVVFQTVSTLQSLMSIFPFRKRCWTHWISAMKRNINASKNTKNIKHLVLLPKIAESLLLHDSQDASNSNLMIHVIL